MCGEEQEMGSERKRGAGANWEVLGGCFTDLLLTPSELGNHEGSLNWPTYGQDHFG